MTGCKTCGHEPHEGERCRRYRTREVSEYANGMIFSRVVLDGQCACGMLGEMMRAFADLITDEDQPGTPA